MPFNGAGTFTRLYSWITDAANGIFVSSTRTDADSNDIASGLSNCLCKDGQSTPTANLPMGGFKHTNLGSGSASGDSVNFGQLTSYGGMVNDFRLSLTTGVPVTVSDVTGAATIYLVPYTGNRIALYNGSIWQIITTAQISLALGTLTNAKPYDVFCYSNSGTPTLEFLVWTNSLTRATALTRQDGVLVKSGDATRRYLGTFYTTAATTTEDSARNRYLWNYYNRVLRLMVSGQNNTTWNYTTATIRQSEANTSRQLNYVQGVSEDMIDASIHVSARNTSAGVAVAVGVGVDSTTIFDYNNGGAGYYYAQTGPKVTTQVVNQPVSVYAIFHGLIPEGRHFLSWNEWSAATGTTTWNDIGGDGSGVGNPFYGWLTGMMRA